jgi:pyruvate,orthophosphate dikinase
MKSEHHLALHGLAVKKYASAASVASVTGMDARRVESILDEFVSRGWIESARGRYSLAPMARTSLRSEYSRFYADIRQNKEFLAGYEEFELVNTSLKALITNWQMSEVAGRALANDHSDPEYDRKIIDQLGQLHDRVDRVLERMTRHLPRLQAYRDKLIVALEHAEDGQIDWLSDVKIESYHTVWFELHEDLLCILGRSRVE